MDKHTLLEMQTIEQEGRDAKHRDQPSNLTPRTRNQQEQLHQDYAYHDSNKFFNRGSFPN